MNNYHELFQQAVQNSKERSAGAITVELNHEPLIAEWLMYELGPKIAETFSRDAFMEFMNHQHSSLRLHHLFAPIVSDLLKVEVYLTTGYVKVANDENQIEYFGLGSLEEIDDAIKNTTLPSKIHTWLTLPSGEVIDLAFMTIYAALYHEPSLIGNIVAKHPKEFTGGMEYMPLLVGEGFYEKFQFDFTINNSEEEAV
jgi:hypothetical protein